MVSENMVREMTEVGDRIIRFRELSKLLGNRSRASIWRDERDGRIPRHILCGARSVGWKLSEVLAHINALGTRG